MKELVQKGGLSLSVNQKNNVEKANKISMFRVTRPYLNLLVTPWIFSGFTFNHDLLFCTVA